MIILDAFLRLQFFIAWLALSNIYGIVRPRLSFIEEVAWQSKVLALHMLYLDHKGILLPGQLKRARIQAGFFLIIIAYIFVGSIV